MDERQSLQNKRNQTAKQVLRKNPKAGHTFAPPSPTIPSTSNVIRRESPKQKVVMKKGVPRSRSFHITTLSKRKKKTHRQ